MSKNLIFNSILKDIEEFKMEKDWIQKGILFHEILLELRMERKCRTLTQDEVDKLMSKMQGR